MSILTDASLIITPNAYKAGSLLAVVPSNGNGDLTWTRNSGATRVNSAGLIENVLANVPRLDYSFGSCPSILLEPQRTNLLTYSSEFDNSSWGKTATNVSINTTIAPNGLLIADTLIPISATNSYVYQNFNAIISTTYSFSVWIKSVSGSHSMQIALYNSGGSSVMSSSTITVTNTWQRFIVSGLSTSTQLAWVTIGGNSSWTTGEDIYVFGSQVETGAYPTSYIPTTSATVTRVADVGSVLTAPLALASITTTFSDNTTNVITTIPSTYQLPLGRIKTIVGL